ncbi:MAG: cbb3-type cytochrome c oxidase subunit 3 [Pseudomonadota bacterium]
MPSDSLFQQILDNWTLVYLFTAFVGICLWVLLGNRKSYRNTAEMIFRNDDKPAPDGSQSAPSEPGEEART